MVVTPSVWTFVDHRSTLSRLVRQPYKISYFITELLVLLIARKNLFGLSDPCSRRSTELLVVIKWHAERKRHGLPWRNGRRSASLRERQLAEFARYEGASLREQQLAEFARYERASLREHGWQNLPDTKRLE